MTPPPVSVAERNQALAAVAFRRLHPRQPPDPDLQFRRDPSMWRRPRRVMKPMGKRGS